MHHSVLLKWCPKRLHFHFSTMQARSQLACLSNNSNVGRQQSKTKEGVEQWKLVFTRQGKYWSAKKMYQKKVDDFLHDLMNEVFTTKMALLRGDKPECLARYTVPELPKNIAAMERPNKSEAVALHQSRLAAT